MRPVILGLVLAALALPPAAQGQSVDPDISALEGSARQSDPLAGQQQRLRLAVQAGSLQGFTAPASMVIPTSQGSIRIDVQSPGDPAQRRPAEPAAPSYALPALALALALFGVSLFMNRRSAQAPPAAAPNLGETPFAIVRAIGQGGMGVVYEAIDRNLDRRVAVKKLLEGGQDDPEAHRQLIKEAKTVAALRHPNIVDIHAVVSQGGQAYLVFELIEGRTVEELLLERKSLTLAEVRAILDPVCRALEFAHERGIVHRDLKPSNIMITTLGQIKVMDFGIARHVKAKRGISPPQGRPDRCDITNTVAGTPRYISPEANFGEVRPEGDVYALGIMAYRMLSGDFPFPLSDSAMPRDCPSLSRAVPGLPPAIDALINEALEPDAAKRLHTPREFRERLAAL